MALTGIKLVQTSCATDEVFPSLAGDWDIPVVIELKV